MNQFGTMFRVSILGESHGERVGVLLDGLPAGLPLTSEDLMDDIERRRPGAPGTTPRIERDLPLFQTGLFEGHTTGAPLLILFENSNTRSSDYSELAFKPRPGHADLTSYLKFGGHADHRGGGHFSGRLTVGLVAAGAIAKKIIAPVDISARVTEAGGTDKIENAAKEAADAKNSIGGIVECIVSSLPAGLGEPFFDSTESLLAHGAFAIPGIKGVEFGAGFKAATMRGGDFNDEILDIDGRTRTNNAGGINGGITNGNHLVYRVAVRPPASIGLKQSTINLETKETTTLEVQGRHDACIALRVPVVLEAMTAIVLADLMSLSGRVKRIWESVT